MYSKKKVNISVGNYIVVVKREVFIFCQSCKTFMFSTKYTLCLHICERKLFTNCFRIIIKLYCSNERCQTIMVILLLLSKQRNGMFPGLAGGYKYIMEYTLSVHRDRKTGPFSPVPYQFQHKIGNRISGLMPISEYLLNLIKV